jgi:hypothetical protein
VTLAQRDKKKMMKGLDDLDSMLWSSRLYCK